jgi:PAS domain S-box-containing protein
MDPAGRSSTDQELLRRERLAAVVEMATDAIIVVDADGHIRLFNAAAERLFDCPEQDAIGTALERFVPPRLRTSYRAGLRRWRQTHPQVRNARALSVWSGLRTTGDCFPCEVSFAPCDVGGTRELMISVRDITERRRSAKANRHRVEFEKVLFDLSTTFIAIPEDSIDAHMTEGLARVGTFLEMDRVTLLELSQDRAAMTLAYSWSRPEVMSPPPVLTKEMEPWWLRQVLRGDVTLASTVDDLPEEAVAEKEYLRERGVASVASIPLTVGGEIAGAMSFVTTERRVSWAPELVNQLRAAGDILWNALKRRQAMQALLAARETARESEQRFRLIANTAPVMIWMSDVDKQVTYVNQRWLDFTGWPPDEAPGHRWISLIHPDDVERCGDVYVKAFDQRQPFQVDHRLRRNDGEYRWTVTVGVPRYRPDRSFAGYVGTAVDVTDRKLIEAALLESHAALQERTAELERRTAQLRKLASDLTLAEQHAREQLARTLHDGLQQLLVSASMNLDRHVTADTERGSDADGLLQAKSNLDEAINAARSLSFELFPPVLHGSGLPASLTWLADWMRHQHGLLVEVKANPLANSGRKDVRTLLFESVRELLFNTVKHARTDRATLDLSLGADDDTLRITVQDRGVGFDPANVADEAKDGHVGWGLFSIRERLMLLGGRFEIESAPGRGTTFRLIAPRDVARRHVNADASLSRPSPAPQARRAHAASHALRIVIADDQPALRKTFRELLQAQPEFQVVGEAANGLEAIAQARVLRPDVVLMDISMPELDGVEATRRIRAELPFIRVLGFSIYPRTQDPHPIEAAGAEGFFSKGIDTQRLINHLLVTHASMLSGQSRR